MVIINSMSNIYYLSSQFFQKVYILEYISYIKRVQTIILENDYNLLYYTSSIKYFILLY